MKIYPLTLTLSHSLARSLTLSLPASSERRTGVDCAALSGPIQAITQLICVRRRGTGRESARQDFGLKNTVIGPGCDVVCSRLFQGGWGCVLGA